MTDTQTHRQTNTQTHRQKLKIELEFSPQNSQLEVNPYRNNNSKIEGCGKTHTIRIKTYRNSTIECYSGKYTKIEKMTGETQEVCSDKRKPRKDRIIDIS